MTLAWGHHREDTANDHADGYLLEWDLRATDTDDASTGASKRSAKEIFGLGPHPPGFDRNRIFYSHIEPLTIGVVRDIGRDPRFGRLGIGADAPSIACRTTCIPYFDGSRSFHVFLRWRPLRTSMAHVH